MVIKTVKDNKFTLLVCASVKSIGTMLQSMISSVQSKKYSIISAWVKIVSTPVGLVVNNF